MVIHVPVFWERSSIRWCPYRIPIHNRCLVWKFLLNRQAVAVSSLANNKENFPRFNSWGHGQELCHCVQLITDLSLTITSLQTHTHILIKAAHVSTLNTSNYSILIIFLYFSRSHNFNRVQPCSQACQGWEAISCISPSSFYLHTLLSVHIWQQIITNNSQPAKHLCLSQVKTHCLISFKLHTYNSNHFLCHCTLIEPYKSH